MAEKSEVKKNGNELKIPNALAFENLWKEGVVTITKLSETPEKL